MNRKGFTLLELVTVIIIVGILAAAGVPLYLNYVQDAKIAKAKASIDALYSAERIHYQKEQSYWLSASPTSVNIEDNLDIRLDPSVDNNWQFAIAGDASGPISISATGKTGTSADGLSTIFWSGTGTFNN